MTPIPGQQGHRCTSGEWLSSPRLVCIGGTTGPFAVTSGNSRAIAGDYRVIPGDTAANDLVMSHVSTNFDRTGFQQDWNVVLPLDSLHGLAAQGVIGSVAAFHYSFMGATDPKHMEPAAHDLARLLAQDHVNAVCLVPV